MSLSHTLKYAGADPFMPEWRRHEGGAMSYDEYELLTQDETYVYLAEARYAAQKVRSRVENRDDIPDAVEDALVGAVGEDDSLLCEAVDAFVDAWLEDHRQGQEQEEA